MRAVTNKRPGKITFRNRGLSHNSLLTYTVAVRDFLTYLDDAKREANTESVTTYLKLIYETKAPSTYNHRRQALKEFLADKYRDHHLQRFGIEELFKKIKPVVLRKSIGKDAYLSKLQVDNLSKELLKTESRGNTRVALIIQSLFLTGCRVSELTNVKLIQIKLNGKASISIVGKGKKAHTIYLPLGLYHRMREVFQGTKYLIETVTHKRYCRENITRMIRAKSTQFGYDIHAHTMRHSLAMHLKNENGMSADQIAKVLNHANVKTTLENYFHGEPSAEDIGLYSRWVFDKSQR